MEVSYLDFLSCPLSIILGICIIFYIALNRNVNACGLSAAALSDALILLLSSAVSVYNMLNSDNTCNSMNFVLRQNTVLIPTINGLLSALQWNYQCWNKIKVERITNVSKNALMAILPQYAILTLTILYILMCDPETHLSYVKNNNTSVSGKMLAYVNEAACPNNQLNDTLILFENFLQDMNKSKSDILFFNNRIHYPDTEEIVEKIYKLVYEQMNSSNTIINTVHTRRVPRSHQGNEKISSDLKTVDNSATDVLEDEFHLNIYDSYDIYDNVSSVSIINDEPQEKLSQSNLTKQHINEEQNTVSENNVLKNIFNNTENYQLMLQNKSKFNKGLLENKENSTRQFETAESQYCYEMCRMQESEEKVLISVLLFICYMIPVFCTIFLYGKVSVEAINFNEPNITHGRLLRSAKWGLITPLMMLTPLLFSLFLDIILNINIPQWISSLLYGLSQVHPLVKNIINIVTIKKCSNPEGSNKINPTTDEDDNDVVIRLPEIINTKVTEAWVSEEKS